MLRLVVATAAIAALCPSADAFSAPPSVNLLRSSALRSSSLSPPLAAKSFRPSLGARRGFADVSMQLAASAAGTLGGSQAGVVDRIKAARNLEVKSYPAEEGFDSFTIGDAQGTLQAFEAAGKDNVAWCSSLNIAGSSQCLSSLTLWCGPLADVPHLCARTSVTDSSVDLFVDFRPRAYGAYETKGPDGGYGEPETREWFTWKGVRDENAERFFTPEAEAWAASIRSRGSPKPPATGDDALYRGPLTIDVSLPAGDESVALAAKACEEAASMWLGWMDTTEPLPAGMRVTSTYAYDTKMRAQMFGVMVGYYSALYGDQGRALAAADAGPLDEAYVGGAS